MSKERYRLITEYPKDEFFDNKQVVKFDSYEVIRTLNQQVDKIADLEAKLAESEKEIKEWIAVRDDKNNVINKQTEKINQLKQQLAEKELVLDKILTEIHTNCYSGLNIVHFKEMALNDLGEVVITHNQDKISFTVEQLEKVKELLKSFDGNHNGSIDCCETDILNIIDNQIKQLKEMK